MLDPRPWLRTVKLLSLPAAALGGAGAGAVRRLGGADADEVRHRQRRANAERTRRTLGELKGGAQKAGQLLSTVEALFPADPDESWRRALESLQEQAPALPMAEVAPVLRHDLGPGWRGRFLDFEGEAAAAASLGQVHRATWPDGRPVAVKVQYPGVAKALAADLTAVSLMTRAAAVLAPGTALPPLVSEMRLRLAEELDYRTEARHQQAFVEAYRDDPDVLVPAVLLATERVIVTEWLDGTPLAAVADWEDGSARALAAERYQRFLLSGPRRCGWLHTDPHPGNFRILADGRLGVLDFGSALAMPEGMPPTFGRLIRLLSSNDPATVEAGLRAEGFLRPGAVVDARALMDYLAPFSEPARHEQFHYHRDWLRSEFGRINDPRNPDFAMALRLTMPAEHLFTHRVWLGIVGVLSQLDVVVPVRDELVRWLPGFSVEADVGR